MHSLLSEDTLRRFHGSFDRCQEHGDFLERFYDRLLGHSPEIRALFGQADMARIQLMLRQSLILTMVASEGSRHSRQRLAGLGDLHRDVGVRPEHYQLWLETLLSVVEELDSLWDDAVGQAWRDVLGLGIQLMLERYPDLDGA